MNKDITLIIMAAGMGSRFGSLKQIEPVGKNGEVILDFSVYDAIAAGFTKIVFVIKHAIEKDFKEIVGKRIEKKIKVEYVFQELDDLPQGFTCPEGREKPWGTAQAILCCRDVVKEPFAVVNADDYYGKSAFIKTAEYLKHETDNYCMIGFRLANTLTENGYVSRGVCVTDDNNHLTAITERTKIMDCKFTEDDGKTWEELSPDTVVSMNFWGFMPDVFDYIEKGFKEFLKNNINVPKCEYYLPSVVSELVDAKAKTVDVLVAEDRWYGVTYKEDKPTVVKAFADMADAGMYDGI